MIPRTFTTALIGFGQIGHKYSSDPMMSRYYQYATHAQVLKDHPAFDWQCVIDFDPVALNAAAVDWGVSWLVSSVTELSDAQLESIEVLVIATGPTNRMKSIKALPNLKAIFVEKPLGLTMKDAREFIEHCESRNIIVQVNFWRRGDDVFRRLASGEMHKLIGKPLLANVIYGNGILNNGIHMIDFCRMLFGEICSVQLIHSTPVVDGPLENDRNISFVLTFESDLNVVFMPIEFLHYRENGLVVWGQHGRLEVMNEGLVIRHYPMRTNRAMQNEFEIASDSPRSIVSTVGSALFEMYENLSTAISTGDQGILYSGGSSALASTFAMHSIFSHSGTSVLDLH